MSGMCHGRVAPTNPTQAPSAPRVAPGGYTPPVRARSLWVGISVGIGLTIVSASGFSAAFPPTSWRPLAWVALAPLLIALRMGGLRRALGLTWLWCLAAAYGVGDWFPTAVSSYFHQPMGMAIGLFLAVFTLMAGPYYMAFAWAYRRLARRFEIALPLLAGAAWVVAEFGRGALFTGTAFFIGNPWGLLGYSHADTLPLMQIASLGGIYAASFSLACVNAGVAEVAWAVGQRRPLQRALLRAAALDPPRARELRLRADRPARSPRGADGPARHGCRRPGQRRRRLALAVRRLWREPGHLPGSQPGRRRTRRARDRLLARSLDDLLPRRRAAVPAQHQPAAPAHDLELVAGGPVASKEPVGFFNSVFVMEPGGRITQRYDKQYLVPFAEYFPLRVDVMRRRFGRIRYFLPGATTAPLPTRAGPAGVLLCNEAMLPEAARERVADGAAYLLNPSNDTWISDPKYSEQQLDMAIVRAIEQRRWLVRASTSGPSALVDPFGHVTARTAGEQRAVIVGEIRPRQDRTLYSRLGDAFALACLLAVAARPASGTTLGSAGAGVAAEGRAEAPEEVRGADGAVPVEIGLCTRGDLCRRRAPGRAATRRRSPTRRRHHRRRDPRRRRRRSAGSRARTSRRRPGSPRRPGRRWPPRCSCRRHRIRHRRPDPEDRGRATAHRPPTAPPRAGSDR